MKVSSSLYYTFAALMLIALSCNRGPKIIPLSEMDEMKVAYSNTDIFSNDEEQRITIEDDQGINDDIHTVEVVEVLPTEKYVYLNVSEDGERFWIATQKIDVKVGERYYYKGAFLQTNFESKEYGRTFDEVFFVSEIMPAEHGLSNMSNSHLNKKDNQVSQALPKISNIAVEGSVRIAELVNDPQKYGGKTIQISGQCIKVNTEILGFNWIHLKDGSQDDYDLVITSEVEVAVGEIVTMTGVVSLDKDFGAGYRYEIIIEEGKVLK